MGKGLAITDRAGSSAHAEFRRARRSARRRRVASSACAVVTAVLGLSAVAGRWGLNERGTGRRTGGPGIDLHGPARAPARPGIDLHGPARAPRVRSGGLARITGRAGTDLLRLARITGRAGTDLLRLARTAGRPGLGALAVGAAILTWRLRPDADVERWQRGAFGEERTARLLAALPGRYVVLHDRRVPGSRANIDHLVIGPTGVWVVDTKVYRASLEVRRGAVWAGDHQVDASPAAWEAERVGAALGRARREGACPGQPDHAEVRHRPPTVGAVLAIHGHGLGRRGKRVGGVTVLPADRLCRWLRRRPRLLRRGEVTALAADADRLLPPANVTRDGFEQPGP